MTTMNDLPQDALHVVCGYLEDEDILKLKLTNSGIAKEILAEGYIRLNAQHTEAYLTNASFRARIQSVIRNPSTQLGLFSLELRVNAALLENVGSLHSCQLHSVHDMTDDLLPYLVGVRHLLIGDADIHDLSPFRDVPFESLELPHCSYIGNASVQHLRRVKKLNISFCFDVTDVSCLSDLEALIIYGNHGVTDVSALGRLRYLDISCCDNIRDFDAVTDVPTIIMDGCWRGVDMTRFPGLRTYRRDDIYRGYTMNGGSTDMTKRLWDL